MDVILAIETSTEACSAALYYKHNIISRYQVAPQQHANLILSQCDELLHEADISPSQLSAIAFGRGPGSFTGVRIAAAVAQGIAVSHDLFVIPISSLQALAQEAYLKKGVEKVLAGIDARMKEVYFGSFMLKNNIMALEGQEIVAPYDKLDLSNKADWFRAGSAFQKEDILFPSAEALISIALNSEKMPPELALPVYLRDNVVFLGNKSSG